MISEDATEKLLGTKQRNRSSSKDSNRLDNTIVRKSHRAAPNEELILVWGFLYKSNAQQKFVRH
ncbi:hypothetical protein EDM55_00465 [Brevibacillus centrosporus]|nr:hypothetical protein EDM55_00465 [Brevibacillus centrosporus]